MAKIAGKQLQDLTVPSDKVDGSVLSTNTPARSAPGASYDALGEAIITVGNPPAAPPFVAATSAATPRYIAWKQPVRLATSAVLPAYTWAAGPSGDGELTATVVGALSIDGTPVALNDRVLVTDEVGAPNAAYNGIYIVMDPGGAGPYVLMRAYDVASNDGLISGIACNVVDGVANGATQWMLETVSPIVLNATPLSFVQSSGGGGGPLAGDVNGPPGTNLVDFIQGIGAPAAALASEDRVIEVYDAGGLFPYVSPRNLAVSGDVIYVAQSAQGPAVSPVVFRLEMNGTAIAAARSVDLSLVLGTIDRVRDIAVDKAYVYAACWDANNIAILDKYTLEIVGWAYCGAGNRVVSVTTDDLGHVFCFTNTGSIQIQKFIVQDCLGSAPNVVTPAASLVVANGREIRYGGGKLWLTNGGFAVPNVQRYNSDTLAFEVATVAAEWSMSSIYAFGFVWALVNNGVWNVKRYNPTTLALLATIPVVAPFPTGGTSSGITVGPNLLGTPDSAIVVTSQVAGAWVGIIDPGTDTWLGSAQSNLTPGVKNDGVVSIGGYIYTAGYSSGANPVAFNFYQPATSTIGSPSTTALAQTLRYRSLGGDMVGPVESARVTGIQGIPISYTAPTVAGQALLFDGSQWAPGSVPLPTIMNSFATVAACQAFDATTLDNNQEVYLEPFRAYFNATVEADPGGSDGVTKFRDTANTVTYYRRNTRSTSWDAVTTFYLDGVAGDDGNSGLIGGSPLRTAKEISRRTFGRTTPFTILLVDGIPEANADILTHTVEVTIDGAAAEVSVATGTVQAVSPGGTQDFNYATNASSQLEIGLGWVWDYNYRYEIAGTNLVLLSQILTALIAKTPIWDVGLAIQVQPSTLVGGTIDKIDSPAVFLDVYGNGNKLTIRRARVSIKCYGVRGPYLDRCLQTFTAGRPRLVLDGCINPEFIYGRYEPGSGNLSFRGLGDWSFRSTVVAGAFPITAGTTVYAWGAAIPGQFHASNGAGVVLGQGPDTLAQGSVDIGSGSIRIYSGSFLRIMCATQVGTYFYGTNPSAPPNGPIVKLYGSNARASYKYSTIGAQYDALIASNGGLNEWEMGVQIPAAPNDYYEGIWSDLPRTVFDLAGGAGANSFSHTGFVYDTDP